MVGHPFRDPDPDRRDLVSADPDPGVGWVSAAGDAKIGQRSDQRFFDPPDVLVDIFAKTIEVDDRVPDQLARAVVGDVAAAIDPPDRGAGRRERRFIEQNVFGVAASPQGVDVGMLEEDQGIR